MFQGSFKLARIIFSVFLLIILLSSLALAAPKNRDLIDAARDGNLTKVKSLLSQGIKIDCKDHLEGKDINLYDVTPLIAAAALGRTNVVQFLLTKGANINASLPVFEQKVKNKDGNQISFKIGGETALMLASLRRHPDTAKLLIEKGANVNIKNAMGMTALFIVCSTPYSDLAEQLCKKKADPNARANDGTTPLVAAIVSNQPKIVCLLLDKGAEIDARGPQGGTALLVAIGKEDIEMTKMLIAKGANVNIENKRRETPLKIALLLKNEELIQILKSAGAK